MRATVRTMLFLLLSVAAACEQADLTEKSLEELMDIRVSTASKREQSASDAPASVTVITADEIRKYGYRTLADALRSVRSFCVGYDRNYSYIGFRGFSWPGDYNTRVLLLVDGHRLNDNNYDQGMIGTEFPVDVDLIERIEVIRGPGSSLYGSNAFFAVINVITRRGHDLNGVETSVSAASYGSFQGRASYGKRYKDFEVMVSGTVYDSRGQNLFYREFNSPATNNGLAVHADDDQFADGFARLAWRGFTLEALYSSREKGIPTASFGTVFNDRRNRTVDGRRYVDLSYEHTFAEKWLLNARVFYDQSRYDGAYAGTVDLLGAPVTILDLDYNRGEWWGTELKVSREVLKHHRLTVGSEARHNVRQLQGNYIAQPFLPMFRDDRSSVVWAGYLQDEFTITPKVMLNAGLRYDRYEVFGGTVNPRAGLILRPKQRTTIKLLYGSAFRALNMFEQYYAGPGIVPPAAPLKAETIGSSEIVIEQAIGKHYTFTAAGFYDRMENLVRQVMDPATGIATYANVANVHAKGLEFEVVGKYAGGIEGRASYSVQEAVNESTGQLLTNSPKHLGKLNLIVPLVRDKLFAGLEAQYTSRRRTLRDGSLGGFPVINTTLFNTRLFGNVDLSASVHNLLNRPFDDPGGEEHLQDAIAQDGRNVRVKLTWHWGQR